MSETLEKLRPDRDLQCFFFRPSATAAISGASATGFSVSGSWRQQFDWAVIEWARDNVYEYPLLRNLPDGDLSGLTLSYREERTNCIPIDSNLFAAVDWPFLRIWAENAEGNEQVFRVELKEHATAVAGSYAKASATFELQGTLTEGDRVELSWLDQHVNWTIGESDTIATVLEALRDQINSPTVLYVTAEVDTGAGTITLTHESEGEEGNGLGILGAVSGAQTEQWSPTSQTMSGGQSPTQWQIELDFSALQDKTNPLNVIDVPTDKVRKMRWTYSAALQPGHYERSEFEVHITNWSVTGMNRAYKVAGQGSRRVEDDDPGVTYNGAWTVEAGNFSAGTMRYAEYDVEAPEVIPSVTIPYSAQVSHRLFLGSRGAEKSGEISVVVDGEPEQTFDLQLTGEVFLVRLDLGTFGPGSHTVEATLAPTDGKQIHFDYLEQVVEASTVEAQPARPDETLATDWDTDHSLVLAPERVAWNLQMLGFHGRANHYVGAIEFYELVNPGNVYAQGTVTFSGTTELSKIVTVTVSGTPYARVLYTTDTPSTVAKSFELLINNGSTRIWAEASGNVLTIHARELGNLGNSVTLAAASTSTTFDAVASGSMLSGGQNGALNVRGDPWFVDLEAEPRINRAARDWHRAYFAALDSYGIASTAAFSTELSHGDPSVLAGIAQRYPDGSAVIVNTPGVQTNFSPTSIDYWKQVYLDMATLQDEAGVVPYLQFGEVQWWYFPKPVGPFDPPIGMTFYDDYSTTEFQSRYSHPMHVFLSNDDSPGPYPDEAEFLPTLIGEYCEAIRDFVLGTYPSAKFEVLYPHDVNDHDLTRVVNFPEGDWTPSNLEVLKTENFGHTAARNLDKAVESILLPLGKGFPRNRAAHLIGVFTPNEPWNWERRLSRAHHIESVVLWAFDQFSMVGYALPLREGLRRARFVR